MASCRARSAWWLGRSRQPCFHLLLLLGRVRSCNSLVSEAAVQTGQVERGVAEAAAVAVVPVALAFVSGQDEPVEVVQEAVGGEEDVLDPQAVQVVQVVLRRRGTSERQ